MVTVFLSNLNQLELHLAQNRKENCHHDHIPFNVKGNENVVFSVDISRRHEILKTAYPGRDCEPTELGPFGCT